MKPFLTNVLTTALQRWVVLHPIKISLPDIPIHIERARNPKFGDFATNLALSLAKVLGKDPMDIADEIKAHISEHPNIETVRVDFPGFINFKLSQHAFQEILAEILSVREEYGRLTLGNGQRIHMEFVSSNPTGPLHVGHGRHAAYGASVANILRQAGYQVHREYYVNDAGRQMRILAVSVWIRYLECFGVSFEFPRRGYRGGYVYDIAAHLKAHYGDQFIREVDILPADLPPDDEEQEEKHMDVLIERVVSLLGKVDFDLIFQYVLRDILEDMRADLCEFGVEYEEWFHESALFRGGEVESAIQELRKRDLLYQQEGATWFRATEFGDEKDRVVIRENGQPTYFAADIAYHLSKYARGFDRIVGVYGSDHHGYIPRIHAALSALDKDPTILKTLLVQFAILYRGKTRASMSTRGGEFVTLRELRAEVGNDAARFFYVMRKHEQHLEFDLELAKAQASENPVYYIQYAHARICSVFRQLVQRGWAWQVEEDLHVSLLREPHEQLLVRCLSRYLEVIELAAKTYEPAVVANYLQELANAFHGYYSATAFLVEEEILRNARLCLIEGVRCVLANGLKLLGLSAPEVM